MAYIAQSKNQTIQPKQTSKGSTHSGTVKSSPKIKYDTNTRAQMSRLLQGKEPK